MNNPRKFLKKNPLQSHLSRKEFREVKVQGKRERLIPVSSSQGKNAQLRGIPGEKSLTGGGNNDLPPPSERRAPSPGGGIPLPKGEGGEEGLDKKSSPQKRLFQREPPPPGRGRNPGKCMF